MINKIKTDIVIVGCGVSGLFAALTLPKDKRIHIITKGKKEESDSFLAQGGICVLRDSDDFEDFYNDTLKAGHFENNPESVRTMIENSQSIISKLVSLGVDFEKNEEGGFEYTREGAHSKPRILFNKDETGKEITSKLLKKALSLPNVTLSENTTMVDILKKNNTCYGIICHDEFMNFTEIHADYTILATGGIGGLFKHSTNFSHLTGDALAIAFKHSIETKDIDYIQIHPTTLYSDKKERSFLISESVRGEGAVLLDARGERFVDELLPRDVVTKAIYRQMEKDKTDFVWLSFKNVPLKEIEEHFPNIKKHCLEKGFDITKESIPIVPAQHYYMGGIMIDTFGRTSLPRLYAAGETACNGVHGKNRLASNSLLESLVFAKRAAEDIEKSYTPLPEESFKTDIKEYENYREEYKNKVISKIDKEK